MFVGLPRSAEAGFDKVAVTIAAGTAADTFYINVPSGWAFIGHGGILNLQPYILADKGWAQDVAQFAKMTIGSYTYKGGLYGIPQSLETSGTNHTWVNDDGVTTGIASDEFIQAVQFLKSFFDNEMAPTPSFLSGNRAAANAGYAKTKNRDAVLAFLQLYSGSDMRNVITNHWDIYPDLSPRTDAQSFFWDKGMIPNADALKQSCGMGKPYPHTPVGDATRGGAGTAAPDVGAHHRLQPEEHRGGHRLPGAEDLPLERRLRRLLRDHPPLRRVRAGPHPDVPEELVLAALKVSLGIGLPGVRTLDDFAKPFATAEGKAGASSVAAGGRRPTRARAMPSTGSTGRDDPSAPAPTRTSRSTSGRSSGSVSSIWSTGTARSSRG